MCIRSLSVSVPKPSATYGSHVDTPAGGTAQVFAAARLGTKALITNGDIEPSSYKSYDPTTSAAVQVTHERAKDGSISTDSVANWIAPSMNFPGGWSVMDTMFSAVSPFDTSQFQWTNQGQGWFDWGIASAPPPNGPTAPFSLASTDASQFPMTTEISMSVTGPDPGESDSNTFTVKWHLPLEKNTFIGTTYSKEARETRVGPLGSGAIGLVQATKPIEFDVTAFLDGAAVYALHAGQYELTALVKLVEFIASIVEWKKDIGPEAAYDGARNDEINWKLAHTDDGQKYGHGNLNMWSGAASVGDLPDGWQFCDMSIVEFAHIHTDSWYCDGYTGHGFDGKDKHLLVVPQLDNASDEPVFTQTKMTDGSCQPPGSGGGYPGGGYPGGGYPGGG